MSDPVRYLLDTNILSDLIHLGRESRVAAKLEGLADAVFTSVFVTAELRFGVAKKRSRLLAQRVEAILGSLEIIHFMPPADVEYGGIRAFLERRGTPIGPNDLLIAAQCRALDMRLVTANVEEFRRVPGLAVENWLDP